MLLFENPNQKFFKRIRIGRLMNYTSVLNRSVRRSTLFSKMRFVRFVSERRLSWLPLLTEIITRMIVMIFRLEIIESGWLWYSRYRWQRMHVYGNCVEYVHADSYELLSIQLGHRRYAHTTMWYVACFLLVAQLWFALPLELVEGTIDYERKYRLLLPSTLCYSRLPFRRRTLCKAGNDCTRLIRVLTTVGKAVRALRRVR